MSALERRYGSRSFATDDPANKEPMQRIADLLGEAARVYAALPAFPQRVASGQSSVGLTGASCASTET